MRRQTLAQGLPHTAQGNAIHLYYIIEKTTQGTLNSSRRSRAYASSRTCSIMRYVKLLGNR